MREETEFEAPAAEELQKGFTQYRIEKLVAVGGMGAVYRATQVSVDRTVAFKILSPEYAENAKFRERFALEAKAMAKLNHPNIVQLYDFGESGGVIWMAQEWVPGQTVEDVLESEGAMEPSEAAAMVAQACEGLGYAHSQGIVHRDVKPANMMQGRDGNVKVMDFGLAHASHWSEPSLQSEEGARYATTEYAGPEIWEMDREPDHRVDIFALGVLLFEALTGERPMDPFRAPSEIRPDLDPRFDEIVMRSMQTLPEDRFQNCGEFLMALREVVTTPRPPVRGQLLAGGPISSMVPPQPAVPTAGTQPGMPGLAGAALAGGEAGGAKLWWIAGGLGVAVILVLVAILLKGGKTPPASPKEGGPTAEELAGNAIGSSQQRNGQTETPRQRVERLAKEQLARLEAEEEERRKNPPPPKKQPPKKQPPKKPPAKPPEKEPVKPPVKPPESE